MKYQCLCCHCNGSWPPSCKYMKHKGSLKNSIVFLLVSNLWHRACVRIFGTRKFLKLPSSHGLLCCRAFPCTERLWSATWCQGLYSLVIHLWDLLSSAKNACGHLWNKQMKDWLTRGTVTSLLSLRLPFFIALLK